MIAPTPEILPGGSWQRPATAGEDGGELAVEYAAGGAFATVEGAGEIAIELDGSAAKTIDIGNPGLYALAEHPSNEAHRLTLRPTPGLRIWSVSFAAAARPRKGKGDRPVNRALHPYRIGEIR